MSTRSVIVGIVCAAFLSAIAYFSDCIIGSTFMIGNYLPISVFGTLVFFLMVLNPLLGRISESARFGRGEVAVVLSIVLVTCFVPGRGLTHHFANLVMLPHHYEKQYPAWREYEVLDDVPPGMLAEVTDENEERVLKGYVVGLRKSRDDSIAVSDIPWEVWKKPVLFWAPLILALSLGIIGLSLVVHRQWASHEHLPYPIATFADSVISGKDRSGRSILRSPMFLVPALLVFLFHMNNYTASWFTGNQYPFMTFPRHLDLMSLSAMFPQAFQRGNAETHMLGWTCQIFFVVIAFAYFLPTDVSFSLGIGPYIYTTFLGIVIIYSLDYEPGPYLYPSDRTFMYAGAFFAIFVTIAYTGRRYYGAVFKRCFGARSRDKVEPSAVNGARLFLAGAALFVLQLSLGAEMDWQIAILFTIGAFIVFVVTSRIVAEAGVFFLHSYVGPCSLLLGIFGLYAIGPRQALIMGIVSAMLLLNHREMLMPFAVHAVKIADGVKARLGRTMFYAGIALPVCMVIAVGVAMYIQYNYGILGDSVVGDYWPRHVPQFPFDANVLVQQDLDAQGLLESSDKLSGWQRFAHIRPDRHGIGVSFAMFAIVLLLTAVRLRFHRWPLHPVTFLIFGTWPAHIMCFSFLLGCAIKAITMKYGGNRAYNAMKPMMIGVIAGDMLSGLVPLIIGTIYYYTTGERAPGFVVLQ